MGRQIECQCCHDLFDAAYALCPDCIEIEVDIGQDEVKRAQRVRDSVAEAGEDASPAKAGD